MIKRLSLKPVGNEHQHCTHSRHFRKRLPQVRATAGLGFSTAGFSYHLVGTFLRGPNLTACPRLPEIHKVPGVPLNPKKARLVRESDGALSCCRCSIRFEE